MPGQQDIANIALQLARHIKTVVSPHLGLRQIDPSRSNHADVAFQIDSMAEDLIFPFLRTHLGDFAFFSEHQGLVTVGHPEWVFVIDPIDGTRGAKSSLESCLVSVAAATYAGSQEPCLQDVRVGALVELKQDRSFLAVRQGGYQCFEGDTPVACATSQVETIDEMALSIEIIGRPSRPLTQVLSPLMDACGLHGGVFSLCSSAFSLCCLVTGQMDAYLDIGGRVLQEIPEIWPQARAAAGGEIMGMFAYDIAAAYVLAQEAGLCISDAWGKPLDRCGLFGVQPQDVLSCVATATDTLHQSVLHHIDVEFARMVQ